MTPKSLRIRSKNTPKGFTLIELMIATVITVVFSVAIYVALLSSVNLSKTARETSVATAELESILEEINNTPFTNLTVVYPGSVPRPLGQSVETPPPCYDVNPALDTSVAAYRDRFLNDERVWVEYPNPGTDPLEVRIRIWWRTYRGTHREESISTMRTNV